MLGKEKHVLEALIRPGESPAFCMVPGGLGGRASQSEFWRRERFGSKRCGIGAVWDESAEPVASVGWQNRGLWGGRGKVSATGAGNEQFVRSGAEAVGLR